MTDGAWLRETAPPDWKIKDCRLALPRRGVTEARTFNGDIVDNALKGAKIIVLLSLAFLITRVAFDIDMFARAIAAIG